jgi:hypothetical protein
MTFRPRIRTIKPEMWADEKVGQLSRDARLLFVGLITMADDEGRLRGCPAAILGHVFPYDDDALRKLDGMACGDRRRAAWSRATRTEASRTCPCRGSSGIRSSTSRRTARFPYRYGRRQIRRTGVVPDEYGTTTGNVQYVNGSGHVTKSGSESVPSRARVVERNGSNGTPWRRPG